MSETFVLQDVLKRIKQLTADLETMSAGFSRRVFQPEKSSNSVSVFEVPDSAEAILKFQEALDDLRHAIWLYAEIRSDQAPGGISSRSKLLGRATEILCALSLHPPLPKPDSAHSGSFVERVLRLMESSPASEIEAQPAPPPPTEGEPVKSHHHG